MSTDFWDIQVKIKERNRQRIMRRMAMLTALVTFLITFLCGWLTGFSSAPTPETTIICESGSQVLVNEPNEYPAWELECRTVEGEPLKDRVRIIVVD